MPTVHPGPSFGDGRAAPASTEDQRARGQQSAEGRDRSNSLAGRLGRGSTSSQYNREACPAPGGAFKIDLFVLNSVEPKLNLSFSHLKI